jgi:transcriptional regulator with XRE-family HTH domain
MSKMRELREAAGLSQYELAKAAEVSRSTVSMIERGERGNPSLYIMQWLSVALGVSTECVVDAIESDCAAASES